MLWIKAFHIIFVVSWFAGLFYIFRLFVYHVENKDKPEVVAVLAVMERRLFKVITTPAMVFTVIFGVAMIFQNQGLLRAGWFHAKLAGLMVLFSYHGFSGWVLSRFSRGDIFLTSRQCRLINEVPTLVLIAVMILAVLKPF